MWTLSIFRSDEGLQSMCHNVGSRKFREVVRLYMDILVIVFLYFQGMACGLLWLRVIVILPGCPCV